MEQGMVKPQDVKKENTTSAPQQKKEAPKPKEKGRGIVKSVPSGDTILVIHYEKNQQGPPQEREITLTNISAPKLGRRKTNKSEARDDEPFAWQSRDYLRKKVVGKQVVYTIETKDPKSNKEYGTVFLVTPSGEQENLANLIVAEGWAKLRTNVKRDRSDLEDLVAAEESAQKANKGVWTKSESATAKRPLHVEVNPAKLFESLKGSPQTGVIEQVITGSRVRVTLLPSYATVELFLSGVESPNIPFDGEAEPYAREAKFFTEHFLLNRDVQVILEGFDKFNLYGTISLGTNNISEELLKNGLAKYVDWSGARTAFAEKFRAAEKVAKEKKLRIWSAFVEPKPLSRQEERKQLKPGKEVVGKVVKVINGGAVKVLDNHGREYDVYMSSIRLPRQGNTVQRPNESREEAIDRTLAWEAKEYTRKRTIGQRVRCVLDYVRPEMKTKDQNTLPERAFFSVYVDKNNIAVELVEHGLAQAQEHRSGEPRSKDYEFILFAEERAKKGEKGIYTNPSKAAVAHINDLSLKGAASKAKAFLPSLKRAGRMRAVVEYCFSASKVKLYVPKEGCLINFALAVVKAPRFSTDKEGKEPEPFGEEAAKFTSLRCLQHDVEFDVTTQDKGGNFIGNLWVNKQNLAALLLEEGLAKINRPALRDAENSSELIMAEETAKKARKNVWKDYDPAVEEAERQRRQEAYEASASSDKPSGKQEAHNVRVTEIVDGSNLYLQFTGEAEQLEELMKNLSVSEPGEPYLKPAVGELVKAQFTDDDAWYRAKVVKTLPNNEVEVLYVDYGNSEAIPTTRVRRLEPTFRTLRPQAQAAKLAFLRTPTLEEEFGEESGEYLRELVWDRPLVANVEYREGEQLMVTLYDRENNALINALMLRAGLARLERVRGRQFAQLVEKLKEEETKARQSHECIWQYGDPGSDDEL